MMTTEELLPGIFTTRLVIGIDPRRQGCEGVPDDGYTARTEFRDDEVTGTPQRFRAGRPRAEGDAPQIGEGTLTVETTFQGNTGRVRSGRSTAGFLPLRSRAACEEVPSWFFTTCSRLLQGSNQIRVQMIADSQGSSLPPRPGFFWQSKEPDSGRPPRCWPDTGAKGPGPHGAIGEFFAERSGRLNTLRYRVDRTDRRCRREECEPTDRSGSTSSRRAKRTNRAP